nr:reverse transcriptase domain-containing protein [Tanacetum cinerariifolium]
MGANEGVEGVNRNVKGSNGGAPDFSTIIAQQLQNLLPAMLAQDLLPAMLAQVGNQGNVGNQNGNVVNGKVQENVRNVLVNGNRSKKIEIYVYGLAPQIRWMVAATESKTIQKAVKISGALTDEAVGNGSVEKVEKKGNVGEPSKDKNLLTL